MPDVKITALPPTVAPLDGDELVPLVNDPAGVPATEQTTVTNLRGDSGNVLGATADGDNSVAIGTGASATGTAQHVAIGPGATVSGDDSASKRGGVAIGRGASATGIYATAVGSLTNATGTNDVVIGREANRGSPGAGGVAIGGGATVGHNYSVVIGLNSSSSGSFAGESVLVGSSIVSVEADVVAVGASAVVSAARAVALGRGASTTHADSVALGEAAATTAPFQVMIGPRDLEIEGIAKGIVLVDRTLSTRHRVYLDNGALTIEAA